MEKTLFEIRKASYQIGIKTAEGAKTITDADILDAATGVDSESVVIASFCSKEEALVAFDSEKTQASWSMTDGYPHGKLLYGEVIYIAENTYDIDEDGGSEWIAGGDIWEYATGR